MGSEHDHAHDHGTSTASASVLSRALMLTGGFMIVEVISGLLTNSLALLSDAAHTRGAICCHFRLCRTRQLIARRTSERATTPFGIIMNR